MINIITEGSVNPKFLTADDVKGLREDIPKKSAAIDELMGKLAGKMGTDEKVPWENIDNPDLTDAVTNTPGITNVLSFADSNSKQGVPSVWIVKKLLSQTKASPSLKINGKPLTSDITFTPADFNTYDAATIRAKFATPVTPGTAMKLGAEKVVKSSNTEIGAGHVLVHVYYDATNGWTGVYKPLIAILQDGTEQVVPFL